MTETIKSIADWNEQTFPDATFDDQRQKFYEEMGEYNNTDHKDISELADMFIVACGAIRFDLLEAMFELGTVCYFANKNHEMRLKELRKAVNDKMEINRKRKWGKTDNGTYHHIANNEGANE